jgi:hypothetical protein
MPLGVEVPLVGCRVVDDEKDVWLTMDGNGASAHTVVETHNRVRQVDARDGELVRRCPGADALIQPRRTGGPFLEASCAFGLESKQALRIRPNFVQGPSDTGTRKWPTMSRGVRMYCSY